jgi:pimeloyl-ACP methyl ester carboxylesterase
MEGRKAKLEQAAAKLSDEDLYPYDRATATGNGIALQCLYWPPEQVPDPPPAGQLPDVPVVLLGGTRDLSTPLEWTKQAATRAPRGKLIVVSNDGHGVQSQKNPKALGAVRALVASLR